MLKRTLAAATLLLFTTACASSPHAYKNEQNQTYLEAIRANKTDEQVEKYLTEYLTYAYDKDNYNKEEYMAAFPEIHAHKQDDCDGGAVAAIALLSDDSYKTYLLKLYNKNPKESDHLLCVYQAPDGKYGSLSINWIENATGKNRTELITLLNNLDIWTSYNYQSYTLLDVTQYKHAFAHGKGNYHKFIKKLIESEPKYPFPPSF